MLLMGMVPRRGSRGKPQGTTWAFLMGDHKEPLVGLHGELSMRDHGEPLVAEEGAHEGDLVMHCLKSRPTQTPPK